MVPTRDDRARVGCCAANPWRPRRKVAVHHVRVPRNHTVHTRLSTCVGIGFAHDGGDGNQERHRRRPDHDEARYALLKLVHHYRQPLRVPTYFDGRPRAVGELSGSCNQYSIASISGEGSSINAQNRSRMAVVISPGAPSPSVSPSSVTIGVTPPAVVTAISSSASYSS